MELTRKLLIISGFIGVGFVAFTLMMWVLGDRTNSLKNEFRSSLIGGSLLHSDSHPVITGGVSLVVTLHTWLAKVIEPSALNTFGWGIPFLIPLVHLLLERWKLRMDDFIE